MLLSKEHRDDERFLQRRLVTNIDSLNCQ